MPLLPQSSGRALCHDREEGPRSRPAAGHALGTGARVGMVAAPGTKAGTCDHVTRLKLDYDGTIPTNFMDRVRALFRWLGGRAAVIEVRRSRRGYHAIIHTRAQWARSRTAVVAAQAILGSDPKREMFNLMRALRLADAPAFWWKEHRWNTLYARKVKG